MRGASGPVRNKYHRPEEAGEPEHNMENNEARLTEAYGDFVTMPDLDDLYDYETDLEDRHNNMGVVHGITLDRDSGRVWEWRTHNIYLSASTPEEWQGHHISWQWPPSFTADKRSALEGLKGHFGALVSSYRSEWDGHNFVARSADIGEDLDAIGAEIESRIEGAYADECARIAFYEENFDGDCDF
jgi:hypothetical protein